MKTRYSAIILLLFTFIEIFSQDSLPSPYDRIYGAQDKKKTNSVFFSYAAGYSSLFPDDKQPDAFLAHEASIGLIIKEHWIIGLKFEFWNSEYKYYYLPGSDSYQIIKYKGFGTILNLGYKYSFHRDKASVNGGFGIGNYNRSEGIEEYDHTSSYPDFSLLAGFSYHPLPWLSIDSRGSYHMLFGMTGGDAGGKLKNILNVKIGATYYIQY